MAISQFLSEGLSSFNLKGFCYIYTWSSSLCEGKTSFCIGLTMRKLSDFFFVFATGFTSFSVLFIIPLLIIIFFFVHGIGAISFNVDQVLSINPSVNVFVFKDFNFHLKDWMAYSDGTDKSGELCYNFLILNTLFKWLTFKLGSLTLTVLLFWISLFLLTLLFILYWLSLHWEILVRLVVSVSINFPSNSEGDVSFHCTTYGYSCVDWGVVFVII